VGQPYGLPKTEIRVICKLDAAIIQSLPRASLTLPIGPITASGRMINIDMHVSYTLSPRSPLRRKGPVFGSSHIREGAHICSRYF
jgi:hypothetical protein